MQEIINSGYHLSKEVNLLRGNDGICSKISVNFHSFFGFPFSIIFMPCCTHPFREKQTPDKCSVASLSTLFSNFLNFSLHHAFSWNLTTTLGSYFLFSLSGILCPGPLKIVCLLFPFPLLSIVRDLDISTFAATVCRCLKGSRDYAGSPLLIFLFQT